MTSQTPMRARLPAYPIEVTFPDIAQWKTSQSGVDYIHTFESTLPGPHVMLLALTHGNEVSGAIAVATLLELGLRPAKGRLSLGFANVEAYSRFDAINADATRFIDEDLNRVWSDSSFQRPRDSIEFKRAIELRPLIDTVDFLLDIHSMHEASAPLMMCGPLDKGMRFAAALGFPEYVIIDKGHPNGTRLRDYQGFGDAASPKNALLIETGQHFSASSRDTALDCACRFLIHTGVVSSDDVAAFLTQPKPARQHFIQITHPVVASSTRFTFTQDFRGLEIIKHAGTVIAHDGDIDITTPYDDCIIIQPSLRQLAPQVTVARLGRITNPLTS